MSLIHSYGLHEWRFSPAGSLTLQSSLLQGAGRLLAQDESDGSRIWYHFVYVKKRKPCVAGARFLPWCACPLSPACRSAGRSDICWAGMTTGPDRWLSPPRQTDAAFIRPS